MSPKLLLSLFITAACGIFLSGCAEEVSSNPSVPDDIRVKYNNEGLTADLGVGLWGIPIPSDYDGDGINDLFVSCPDKPYKGIYYFHNIGTNDAPLFDKPVKVYDKGPNNIKLSVTENGPRVLMKGFEYTDFFNSFLDNKTPIEYEGEVIGEGYKRSRSNMWSYVDWDNDGDLDIIVGVDTWDDYGWDNAFNEKGEWTRGPLHGYVYLLENIAGKYVNKGKINAGDKPIDVFGAPNPAVYDFDGDGDLDIICGEFVDRLTWFENIGTREKPRFAEGRILENDEGVIKFHLEMIVPVGFDFNNDGHMDLVVGDEDGRVAFLENTGKVKDGMPQFKSPVYFRQVADNLKFGALSTPCAVDWDGDGRQDIVAGNSAGNIAFIKNMGGKKNSPTWAEPQFFTVGGKPIHIQAGYNGSIQGPAESKWGYTVLSVADWDGDGLMDLIVNSIWGQIVWYKNLGSPGKLEMAPAQPVKVKWDGEAPKPAWNWWKPEPGTLATQWRTTPVAIDWNGDGLMDLIVLDHEGYLAYFERFRDTDGELYLKPGQRIFYGENCSVIGKKTEVADATPGLLRLNAEIAGASGRKKICFTDWDGDGDLDLVINGPNCVLMENVRAEDGKTYFAYRGNMSEVILAGHTTCPTPVNWDGKGLDDILLGAEDGHFYLIENPNNKSKRK